MNDAKIGAMLSSNDPDVVLEALYALGAERGAAPSEDVFREAMAQFHHPDSDVRREAVFAVGVHWGFLRSFGAVVSLLEAEKVKYVAGTAVSAISRLASEDPSFRDQAVDALAEVCLAPDRPEDLRAQAFVEVRWLLGKTTAAEHARELVAKCVAVDSEWLRQVQRRRMS